MEFSCSVCFDGKVRPEFRAGPNRSHEKRLMIFMNRDPVAVSTTWMIGFVLKTL